MNIVVTGYFYEKNYGDDLFETIGRQLFTEKILKEKINRIEFIKIENIATNQVSFTCDKLILFGGEVLNDYFLDRVIEFKKRHPKSNTYAVGVSCNQAYEEIHNKMNIFDRVIFRCMADYKYFEPRLKEYCSYAPDIVFTRPINSVFKLRQHKNVGLFFAMPIYQKLNTREKEQFIKNARNFIDLLVQRGYIIYFYPMCVNDKSYEDDLILIKNITNIYTPTQAKKFKFLQSNKKIENFMPYMKYNFCWRFHASVLSIKYETPFITFATTPKVRNILKDNNIEDLTFDFNDYENAFLYLKTHKKEITNKLKKINKKNTKDAMHAYYDFKNYKGKRERAPFYLNQQDYKTIIDYIINNFKKNYSTLDDDFNCNLILFPLTKKLDSPYFYGLRKKLYMGIQKLIPDIKWLIDDLIANSDVYFYASAKEILSKTNTKFEIVHNTINMNYINQFDYEGLHRAGWTYVLHNLKDKQNDNGILCDFYLDRTFHWNNIQFSQLKVIPYVKPWIGFIHHTMDTHYSKYNTTYLFKNKLFISSLRYCKGLIVLSEDLKNKVEQLANEYNVKVYKLIHPTEFVKDEFMFNFNKFKANPHKRIVQIGVWLRDIEAIFHLQLKGEKKCILNKSVLIGKKMDNYYDLEDIANKTGAKISYNDNLICDIDSIIDIEQTKTQIRESITSEINTDSESMCRDRSHSKVNICPSVEVIRYLPNTEYDNLLKCNVVFIKLIEASACNTLIECIVRNTPIIINRLPAVEEILGHDYPLYYTTLDEATRFINLKNIEKAYNYLKKLDKTNLKIETFRYKFEEILKDITNSI